MQGRVLIKSTWSIRAGRCPLAKGDAELGVFLINVLTAPGLDVVGPFPGDLQQDIVFTAALSKDSKETAGAQALITYLKTQEAAAIIKAKGMMP
jgi:molybdate transport system substrate-binding protein